MKYQDYKPAGRFLKLVDGENKVRFVSEAEQFTSIYEGKESPRFIAYVIDRTDGQVKPFTFGASIMGQIASHATGTEYGFDDLPPYDFVINKKGSGLNTEYTVTPARKDTPLTEEELRTIAEQKPIAALAARLEKRDDAPAPGDEDAPV